MSSLIDPDAMYRIRSRGQERPPVEGSRLAQLVRDFVLARHDELSKDGDHWFLAGEVESLFPTVGSLRLIRERLSRDPEPPKPGVDEQQAQGGMYEDERQFPREPWYVARASNVAGPYDQLTITQWYEEGCLLDTDQLRPGLHARWRPLLQAKHDGLLEPPPANTCSVNAVHLVADPPVWMGPPCHQDESGKEASPQINSSVSSGDSNVNRMLLAIVALLGLIGMLCAVLMLLSLAISPEPDPVFQNPAGVGRVDNEVLKGSSRDVDSEVADGDPMNLHGPDEDSDRRKREQALRDAESEFGGATDSQFEL